MSTLDDLLVAVALRASQTPSISDKYRVMLTRNNSIVKDTLSKLWKLSNIVRDQAIKGPISYPNKLSPSKLLSSKELEEDEF
jgi:hypothetical protein